MTGAAPPAEQEKGDAIAAAVEAVEEEKAATQEAADNSGDGVPERADQDAVAAAAAEQEQEQEEEKKESQSHELEEGSGGDGGEGLEESQQITNATVTPLETPSFKEESYVVSELSEAERKALEAFRVRVEEAIKSKTILKKEKKQKEKEKGSSAQSAGSADSSATSADSAASATSVPSAPSADSAPSAHQEVEKAEAEESVAEKSSAPAEDGEDEELAAKKETDREAGDLHLVARDDQSSAGEASAAIAAAEPADLQQQTKFYLWGGIPVHEQEDEKTDMALLKFLRARNFKVEEALAMLKSTIRWRQEFKADEIMAEELAEEGFETLAYEQGFDREGHPVCYNLNPFQSKELSDDKAKLSRFLRWRVQLMEKSIASLDFSAGGINSIVQVIDLQNSPGFRKVSVQAIKKFLSLLHDNYPELAAKQIILNIPWWYVPAVYRSFHDKVVWAGPGKSTETLFKFIAPEHVPARYGGLYRSDDTEFQGVDAPVSELTVKAGEKRELEFPVKEGVQLLWDVSVVGWDVVYGEEFVPETYTVIVRKPKKIAASAQVEPIRNSYKASEPGKLVITIDNSLSKKKKTVVYRTKSTAASN